MTESSFELEREMIFLEGLLPLLSRVFEGSLELGPLPVKLFLREFEVEPEVLLFLLLSRFLLFSFSLLFRAFRLLYASDPGPDLLLVLLLRLDLPGFSPFSTFSTAIDVSRI